MPTIEEIYSTGMPSIGEVWEANDRSHTMTVLSVYWSSGDRERNREPVVRARITHRDRSQDIYQCRLAEWHQRAHQHMRCIQPGRCQVIEPVVAG